jgi:hypothetical protein
MYPYVMRKNLTVTLQQEEVVARLGCAGESGS